MRLTHGLVFLERRDVVDVDVKRAVTFVVDRRRRVVRPASLVRRHRFDDDVVNLNYAFERKKMGPYSLFSS